MLEKLRKALQDWQSLTTTLVREIEAAKQRRDHLLTAPPPADDVAELLIAGLDGHAGAFSENLRGLAAQCKAIGRTTWGRDNAPRPTRYLNHQHGDVRFVSPGVLTDLLRPQLERAIRDAVASWDLGDVGPPLADRPAELTKLDAEIERLEAELAEARQIAGTAGVKIKPLSKTRHHK